MKTKIISVFLVFLLSISIIGCSGSKDGLNLSSGSSTSSEKISDTSVPTSPSSVSSESTSENTTSPASTDNPELEAYSAVLQNKAEFYSTDNKKNLYWKDFLTNKEIYETVFKPTHFTVLDMDGDKVPEVVLELSVGDAPQFYEILHYMDGVTHGYFLVYRGLEGLKADGTFHFSSGAADNGWAKMSFEPNAFKTDIFGYSKSSQDDTDLTVSYFIKDKPVTKEAFDSFIKEQSEKKDPVWYEFSQKNIEAELSAKP